MRSRVLLSAALVGLVSFFPLASARAQEAESSEEDNSAVGVPPGEGMLSDPDDPVNQLPLMRERRAEKDAVFRVSPLQKAHDNTRYPWATRPLKIGLALAASSSMWA